MTQTYTLGTFLSLNEWAMENFKKPLDFSKLGTLKSHEYKEGPHSYVAQTAYFSTNDLNEAEPKRHTKPVCALKVRYFDLPDKMLVYNISIGYGIKFECDETNELPTAEAMKHGVRLLDDRTFRPGYCHNGKFYKENIDDGN